jgi:hypothetical protein
VYPSWISFSTSPAANNREVVGVRLNGGEHFTRMRPSRLGSFDLNVRAGERAINGVLAGFLPSL